MQAEEHETTMKTEKKDAWVAFKDVFSNFLLNYKDSDYIRIVLNTLDKLKELGCSMNVKIHYFSHKWILCGKFKISRQRIGAISTSKNREGKHKKNRIRTWSSITIAY